MMQMGELFGMFGQAQEELLRFERIPPEQRRSPLPGISVP